MTVPAAAALTVLAGILVAVQAAALGPLTRAVPPVLAAFWSQLLGVVAAVALVLASRTAIVWPGGAAAWAVVAGACTVGIVTVIGSVVGSLGLAVTLATVTAAQLFTGLALDAVGVSGRTVPLNAARVLGAVLIIAGVALLFGRTGAAGGS